MIIICGPTATGKTSLGIELAKRLNGEIVGADSMQIYKYLNIGTAKPTMQERAIVPYHLVDFIEPQNNFSVSEYKTLAQNTISEIYNKGKVPIVIGGTGLYINSLLFDYHPFSKDDALRNELNEELKDKGPQYLYEKLAIIDSDAAQIIHPNNVKRVIRAIEVKILTGKSLVDKRDRNSYVPSSTYVCNQERPNLYNAIDNRVEKMFAEGLEQEVAYLLNDINLNFDLQSMQAIGYKEFQDYFYGNESILNIKEKIKQHTRNYAKRQITWFKKLQNATWLDCNESEKNINIIISDYNNNLPNN